MVLTVMWKKMDPDFLITQQGTSNSHLIMDRFLINNVMFSVVQ